MVFTKEYVLQEVLVETSQATTKLFADMNLNPIFDKEEFIFNQNQTQISLILDNKRKYRKSYLYRLAVPKIALIRGYGWTNP